MNEFNIGDEVVVVDHPNYDCPFSWVEKMDQYCGKEVHIVGKKWNPEYQTFRYEIDADNGRFYWCGDCFHEGVFGIKDISDEEFANILHMSPDE